MSLNAGLVGLPNVGKSTLFNAITRSCIPAEDYPFCTIDPHRAYRTVPDDRLEELQKKYQSKKIVPARLQVVDIAGLVKGASAGEGLGNQFLAAIRDVDLIIHVVRCFQRPTGPTPDPLGDLDVIMTELGLKDLETVANRLNKLTKLEKQARTDLALQREMQIERAFLEQVEELLKTGTFNAIADLYREQPTRSFELLTGKPSLIIANIGEADLTHYKENEAYKALIVQYGSNNVIAVSAQLEAELAQLDDVDQVELLASFGMERSALEAVIQQTYATLGLITFFTCGPQEIHAWPLKKGSTVRQAAGKIHTDMERGFICAEVFNVADLLKPGTTLTDLKSTGLIRREGQNYLVQDGDCLLIRFNV